jgi:hypothetical protein
MSKTRWAAALATAGWVSLAGAQSRGGGEGLTGGNPPPTKNAGPEAERASLLQQRDPRFERGLGLLGAAGAATDRRSAWRLEGLPRPYGTSVAPSYGEAAQQASGGGQSYEKWKSGDLVRSTSAADVRSARLQQAPDLEWTGAQASPDEGNETYGKKFQHEQEKPKR